MSQDWTPPPAAGTSNNVSNYLVLSIIATICCFPLGVIGLIFAAQVNGKVTAGDIAGAMDASKKAKLFSYIGLGLGILLWGGYLLFAFVIGGLSIIGNM
jgi:hypothetical protein